MQLEFHQLDRRWEHLRVRDPARQRRLLASLAEAGQQVPIVVVAAEGQANHYVVIDGYKRLAALQRLGRDTVEAVVWPMGEAEALLLDRTLRWSAQETALEQGWLLQEMEQRFGHELEELARRFDRSVSWVSRRLALVELLPEAVQLRVREGKISAQVAMKYLVPVGRVSLEDCQRMAAAFAQHHWNTRQAGQLYAAWREGSPLIRQRLLDQPELFFKAQRQVEAGPEGAPATAAALRRDLEIVAPSCSAPRGSWRARRLWNWITTNASRPGGRPSTSKASFVVWPGASRRSHPRMLSQAQRTTILELHRQGMGKREIARALGISRPSVRNVLHSNAAQVPELHRAEKADPYRQRILELFSTSKGNLVRVHEELVAGGAQLSYPALTAFCRRHGIGQAPMVPAGRYDFAPGQEMQHDTSPHEVQRNCLPPPGALSSPIGRGFREAWRLGLAEPLLHVTAERVDQQQLAGGAIRLVIAVHPAPPLRLVQRDPVGRPIAGPGEALAVDQGLQ
jgi:ParB/RepB/Spo0J family partition protein